MLIARHNDDDDDDDVPFFVVVCYIVYVKLVHSVQELYSFSGNMT